MTAADYLLGTPTAGAALDNLHKHTVADLAALIVNDALNDFIRETEKDEPLIPYQGWYWRDVDFFAPFGVTIADGDGQVAVCQNNKWGYPQRSLTEAEVVEFLALVWDAWLVSRKGGALSDIQAATQAALALAGEFIAGLDVPKQVTR